MQSNSNEHQRDAIRLRLRARRKQLRQVDLQRASEALLKNCLPFLESAKSVAGYQAMGGEIPLNAVFDFCHANNITTLLPIMQNQQLVFAPFDQHTVFETKQYGILEPQVSSSKLVAPLELDIVLVPLVAFDNAGNRIGMGGGFYDRSFAQRKQQSPPPTLIGVAHAFQEVESAFAQPWDVRLDKVVTDSI